jgi:hypothetical protein
MCEDAKRRYNACLEITDLSKLRARIFEEGQIVEQGCKVSDIFQPGEIQPVIYEARSRDILDGGGDKAVTIQKGSCFPIAIGGEIALIPQRRCTNSGGSVDDKDSGPRFAIQGSLPESPWGRRRPLAFRVALRVMRLSGVRRFAPKASLCTAGSAGGPQRKASMSAGLTLRHKAKQYQSFSW